MCGSAVLAVYTGGMTVCGSAVTAVDTGGMFVALLCFE